MDMNQYLDIFIEESREHLQHMNDNLLELEKNPNEKNLLNEIFRVAHTIKGMSGTMGFSNIASLTHEMENLLDALRNDEVKASAEIIDILFRCFDSLDEYINHIIETGEEGELDSTDLVKEIYNSLHKDSSNISNEIKVQATNENELDEYLIDVLNNSKEKGLNSYKINVKISKECILKAARAFIVFSTAEQIGEIVYSNPPAEDIENEKFDLEFSIVLITDREKDEVKEELEVISEIESIEVSDISIQTSNDNKDKANNEVKNLEKSSNREKEPLKQMDQSKKPPSKSNNNNRAGKTVRVDIDRLDNLMNLVSELIIIKTRLEDTGANEKSNMNEAIEYLERITTSLHDAVMKVRMVPIERVFNRFPRMVRDLTKELGKEIDLIMTGEETEVDRTIIDEIGEPLIHLLRNSIDHGVEDPETRRKLGKNEIGRVDLKAYPDGNSVVIEIDDDGAGINIEKVKNKAIERGIITEEEAKEMQQDQAVDLLFSAGFSTADTVSDVSGRGVGLDVVKTKIESISGSVEIKTERGIGTKFIIRLPLTLAIIQALLINIADEIYAIPLSSISEISTIDKDEIRKVQNQEVVLFRGKTLPIVRLNRILGIPDKEKESEITIVIVRKGDKEAGLIIDSLIGQQEIVIKSLGKFLLDVPYLSGATILGNGKISLILDINSLI
ncbi:chemotaxis protein CheA [Gottschalkia acidurici 9a]|uniref:Chemotaxis protein CheA n=1 Tax=Gottschalkia acidurici (strain ATCC 7906 / DSM 604 / BCRC 14475 / CIP 104303 / KCTC 5404 / NCIMB 10678 / 9a) TaxID=1128398 RepID=K0B0I9_GOTA9|nr:chemotaxis protein CheA [Gottschalkia acidurici]AFS78587.1 chemotaxis protein CheA [Gottschalkia acidurici 9a]